MPKRNYLSTEYVHKGPALFNASRRIVIKVGSALLVDQYGYFSPRSVSRIVALVTKLHKEGKEVILVSSGAVAASKVLLQAPLVGNKNQPSPVKRTGKAGNSNTSQKSHPTLTERQAYSAIGQVYLMEQYRRAFMRRGGLVGQVLISKFSINHRPSYLNARNTINKLLEQGIIPVINENDPLATDEFRFGENDILGALVAGLMDAELYVILSKISGVYREESKAKTSSTATAKQGISPVPSVPPVYSTIQDLSPEFMKQFKTTTSAEGSGGIVAKLEAARLANQLGVPTLIKNGECRNLFAALTDTSGTLIFTNTAVEVSARKRWLLSQVTPKGKVVIDEGAALAISKGKSLLPGGVVAVEGNIGEGDICNIVSERDRARVIARGMSNYSCQDLNLIKGHRTGEIEKILGRASHTEVVHRDNLALWN